MLHFRFRTRRIFRFALQRATDRVESFALSLGLSHDAPGVQVDARGIVRKM
jgi:hypothetical protein